MIFINEFLIKYISFFICLLFLSDFGNKNDLIIRCDVLELNHYYSRDGKNTFVQLIFWTQHYVPGGPNRIGFRARGFRMMSVDKNLPESINNYFRYIATGEPNQKCYVEVRAPVYNETWTQIDPEAINRTKYRDEEDNYDLIIRAIDVRNLKYAPPELEESKEQFILDVPK